MARALLFCSWALCVWACQSAAAPGAPCTSNATCSAPLACRFGRCRTECAADRDCPSGASCLLDPSGISSCSLDTDLGCATGVGRECATGLVCAADRCAQTCSPSLGCATGAVCVPIGAVSICVPSGSDAGLPSTDAALDAPPPATAPCDGIVEVDTSDAGVGPLHVHLDTTDTPEVGALAFTCIEAGKHVSHQVALHYRMRGTRFLRVDTAVGDTSPLYDTVRGLFDACDAQAAPTACDDDDDGELRAGLDTSRPLAAGTDVVIGVGGLEPGAMGNSSAGPLEVTIEEVAASIVGGACDLTGQTAICMQGACAALAPGDGECRDVVSEDEPNTRTRPRHLALTDAVVVGGALADGDEDCFAFDVLAGQSIFVAASNGRGHCPSYGFAADVTLYDPAGTAIAEGPGDTSTCPPIDGSDPASRAHSVAQGTYEACIRGPAGVFLDAYDLSIAVF